jgi:hypothetical protein
LHLAGCLLGLLFTLKVEVLFFEVSVNFYFTQHHIAKDSNHHYKLCSQLGSISKGEGNESEFQVPVKTRSCTDVFFLIIMLLFIVSLVSDSHAFLHF